MGGRHSDPDHSAFWRSLAAAAGKAVLVLGLLGLATAAAVLYTTGDTWTDGPALVQPEGGSPLTAGEPAETPSPEPDAPTDASGDGDPEPTAEPTPSPTPTAPAVSAQVLDTGGGRDAALEVAELLESWGYEVVAVNEGLCCRDATTVFYSSGRRDEAEALRDRDARFVTIEETAALDQSVDLHVAVGRDWGS